MVLSLDVLPDAASKLVNMISAMYGSIKKCLILDLDNVLWGGIIGDDGLENIQIGGLGIGKAFTELQWWVKKLRSRGIILAVCSKNSESVARQPFEKHPDMVLRLEDIAVFVANWGLKSDNIRHIQRVLNISFESMVFLDDNPFERNLVKESIPEITVPELPEDPADYLEFLYSLNLFETNSFTEEDKERTKLYQVESRRIAIRESFSDAAEFLKSLHMLSEVERFNKFNAPRVAQLSQRSNQFNLRTVRYGEEDIEKILHSDIYFTFAFSLKDNLGDHGLIAVVVLQKKSEDTLFIESWFMSCRVLKRGMEEFTLNSIVNFANANKFKNLVGEYIPTAKNEIVRNHYNDLGFEAKDGLWFLPVNDYKDKICYILEK